MVKNKPQILQKIAVKSDSFDNNKNSSRKVSIGGKDETSSLHIKRKNDGEIWNRIL